MLTPSAKPYTTSMKGRLLMKKLASSLQCLFLLSAVALTILGLFPSEASALKSCEYYCGAPGPYSCWVTSTMVCPSYGID